MHDSIFPPTHWSAVLEAAGPEPDKARRAFEQLCAGYRDAIAHWMRLQRLSPEDAEDATHDFLEHWLQRENPLRGFRRGAPPFRAFLRSCLRRFLSDWHERRRAAKRGGNSQHIPSATVELLADDADSRWDLDFALATQIHTAAVAALQARWESRLSSEGFDRLQSIALGVTANPGYPVLARDLGVAVGTIMSWIFRFRREYHAAFRDAVTTQADPAFIDDDVLHLRRLLFEPPSGALE